MSVRIIRVLRLDLGGITPALSPIYTSKGTSRQSTFPAQSYSVTLYFWRPYLGVGRPVIAAEKNKRNQCRTYKYHVNASEVPA